MNWFDNNPLGRTLAWTGAGLAFVALLLSWAWSWPVSSGTSPASESPVTVVETESAPGLELGPLSQYQVVNERPVFNASRQPSLTVDDSGDEITIDDAGPAEMPAMRLTGVVITPDGRFATLSPAEGGDAVVAREGEPLDGDFVGWTVASIEPRAISMRSSEGDSLELELMVHDQVIAEPPKPEPPPEPDGEMAQDGGEDGQQLTRAEEIRRRIEERREQLRREAEEASANDEGGKAAPGNNYQRTIQQMLQRNRDNDQDNEETDDSEGD